MEVQNISLNKIKMNKNSRLSIDPGDLSELMLSIKSNGLLQPIGVRKNENGGYEVCYGNRRFLAISKLGLTKVPCVVYDNDTDVDRDIKNLTENIQRRNISLVEAGRYIEILQKQGLTSAEIAARIGVGASYVLNCLTAYQQVPKEFRNDIEIRVDSTKKREAGKIPISTVRRIINIHKSGVLSKSQTEVLYRAAKENDNFNPEYILDYAKSIKMGTKNFVANRVKLKQVNLQFFMTEAEHNRLYTTHVVDGHYRSVNDLLIDILKGVKNVPVKINHRKGAKL
jgi:ParB/RepB/Spo0J family partition protein